MQTSSRVRLFAETLIFTSGLVIAAPGDLATGIRFRLPFEIYPGVAYVAYLSWPAFLQADGVEGPDLQLAAYAGPSYTMKSKLRLVQPGGTDMHLDGIPWDGQPFKPPIYYGLRGILWPADARQGLMADFTHIKAKARLATAIEQTEPETFFRPARRSPTRFRSLSSRMATISSPSTSCGAQHRPSKSSFPTSVRGPASPSRM
jgi:hypothetical protein